jgi:hemolysin D
MKDKKCKDTHEFKPLLVEIEDEPLNPLGRSIFWIVLAVFAALLAWAVLGKIDVVVTARGKLIPSGEVKSVQPLSTGVVRSINVQAGDFVRQGQVLMEIDPSDIQPELESMQEDLAQVELEMLRLEALLQGEPFLPDGRLYDPDLIRVQQGIFLSSKERLEKQVRIKEQQIAEAAERLEAERKALDQARALWQLAKSRLERLERVRDIVSREDLDNAVKELETIEHQQQVSAHRIEELRASLGRISREMELVREEDHHRLLVEYSERKQRKLYLSARIDRSVFLSSRQQITSPVDGHVAQLLFHTVGGVVTPAEKLAHIVPADSPLIAKVLVLNRDVGFIGQGMNATLKVDAYNFQRYGTLEGSVLTVSKDSFEDRQLGFVYETFVRPLRATLLVEGRETPVTTGMSVTAEIKVGKRRIIEFFIYPLIKYLDEGMSVR